tara:strand:- start:1799 stop:2125 length:327 start_codon:yes stop_codon:yes gene_type:complete
VYNGGKMFNVNNSSDGIPTIRMVDCPACNKKRLGKYVNEDGGITQSSQETVDVRGSQRYLEVCTFCMGKYQQQDKVFVRENLRKLSKAMIKQDTANDDDTDHKDFSLN